MFPSHPCQTDNCQIILESLCLLDIDVEILDIEPETGKGWRGGAEATLDSALFSQSESPDSWKLPLIRSLGWVPAGALERRGFLSHYQPPKPALPPRIKIL